MTRLLEWVTRQRRELFLMPLPLPPLIPVDRALAAPLGTPRRFYQVLELPAPLAGCEFPYGFGDWQRLYDLGFRNVVCLAARHPHYDPAPLYLLNACELDDLSVISIPDDHAAEAGRIHEISGRVAQALLSGHGVLIHCAAGRGRTGTVLGVVLRMLGIPADDIIDYLDRLHEERSGRGWPESPWQSRLIRKTRQSIPCSRNEK